MKSRIGRMIAYALLGCATLWLPARAAAAEAETVKVGIQSVPTDEVYAAKDWGAPYNLKVDLTSYSSGGEILKAFLAGRIDVGNGGSGRLVTMTALQPDTFYIVAANQYGGDRYGVIVAKDAPYKTVADLKGKKIGVVTGSGCFSTFRVYLDRHGLKESDFQIVNMKVEDLRAAVQEGIIDAAVAWEPHVAIAETMGVAKRIESMNGVNESPNFVLVARKFADAHPDAVARYIATLIDLDRVIKTKPDEAAKLAAGNISKRGVQVDPKALALALTRIKMNPQVTDALLAELVPVAQSMKAAGKIPAVPDFHSVVKTSFYDAAVKLAHATN